MEESWHILDSMQSFEERPTSMRDESESIQGLDQTELHDFQVETAHAALGRADGAPDQLRVFF